jgi:hypothetical protein
MEQKLDPNQYRKRPKYNRKSSKNSFHSKSESSMLASTKASEFDSKIRSRKTGYIEDSKDGYQISGSSMEQDMIKHDKDEKDEKDEKENLGKDAKKEDKQDPDSILRRKERKKRRKAKRRKKLHKSKGEMKLSDSEPDDETKAALQMREILKDKQHVDDVDPDYDDWKKKNLAIFKEENPFRYISDINYTELVGHIIEVYTF